MNTLLAEAREWQGVVLSRLARYRRDLSAVLAVMALLQVAALAAFTARAIWLSRRSFCR